MYTVFIVISGVALVMNGLLVGTALKVRHRPKEMTLMVGLAVVDMGLAILNLVANIYHLETGFDIDQIPMACDFKGAFDFMGVFLSLLLVSLIAMARVTRVFSYELPRVSVLLWCWSLIFFSLILACAFSNEFVMLSDGVDCTPVPQPRFCRGQFSYLCIFIASAANGHRCLHEPSNFNPHPTLTPLKKRLPILVRTAIIILSYLITILPPVLLFFMEAFYPEIREELFGFPDDLFLDSIPLVNSALVLFAHSLVFHQLTLSVRSLANPTGLTRLELQI
ncbi:hypothetical protein L0F63_000315 [Massospora cicadina]|nr:hypothetical protein L0F63_000315 [Massospora cicadina]